MRARRESVEQRAARHDPRQRQARGDALGHDHDVGHDAAPLDGEEAAGAAVAGLDLVGDQQDAVLVGNLAQRRQERRRWDDVAALAEDRARP